MSDIFETDIDDENENLSSLEDNDIDEPITNSTFAPVLQNLFFHQITNSIWPYI